MSMRPPRSSGLALLGLFRFVLATSVVLAHLCNSIFLDTGRNAVVGFFICSGYLITKICNETYKDRPLAFLANRALRIYPTYWMIVLLIVVTRLAYPEFSVNRFTSAWPDNDLLWVNQITILKIASDDVRMIIPQAWSLNVELIYYLVIGLATYRSFGLTIFAFIASTLIALLGLFHFIPVEFYKVPLGAGFMFFGGSLAYFLSSRIVVGKRLLSVALLVYAMAMYVLPLALGTPVNIDHLNLVLLISSAAMPFIILGIQRLEVKRQSLIDVCSYLGKLSYPVFLLHVAVYIPVTALVAEEQGFKLFVVTFAITLGFSVLILQFIEEPIENLRAEIRNRRRLVRAGV